MKTLVIVAHPNLSASQANKRWAELIEKEDGVTMHRLYDIYPDWNIDVLKEQQLVEQHDRIIFQFPYYWCNCPALLKKWLDDVLLYGWAFGSTGKKVHGKELMIAISTGEPLEEYGPEGIMGYTTKELLRPFEVTFNYIGGIYLPPFVFGGIHRPSEEIIEKSAKLYVEHALNQNFPSKKLVGNETSKL
jgi:putative NADPH-quinone reductase